MKCFEELTLEEMTKEEAERYKQELEKMSSNWLYKRIIDANYGESLLDIYHEIEEDTLDHTSVTFFSEEVLTLHYKLDLRKSRKTFSCHFCSGIVYEGDFYYYYKPLLRNVETDETYVLEQPLKVCEACYDYLPKNIVQLESLASRTQAEKENDFGIKYNHLSSIVGGEIALKKIKSGRRR